VPRRSPGDSVLTALVLPLSCAGESPIRRALPSYFVRRTVVLRAGRAPPPRAEIGEGEGDGYTANYHLRNILGKVHLRNRIQAAVYAVRQGLVEDPPKG